jgi:Ca2+-binding EF-hand superfamily protein
LRDALKTVGIDIPGYQARALEDEFKKSDRNKDGKLSLDEFEKVSPLNQERKGQRERV